jgi:AcrR family transcriptional regulator
MHRTKPDRRVTRTDHSLHVALNRLILEIGYERTTIKDITDRANVSRSTFYAHHGSKSSLLLHGFEHVRAALLASQRDFSALEGPRPVLGFSRAFFEHVHQYRELHQALARSERGPAVTAKLKRIVTELVANELAEPPHAAGSGAVPRDALIHFTVDALFSILGWWLERRPKLAPTQVDALFRRLVLPAFTAAGAQSSP